LVGSFHQGSSFVLAAIDIMFLPIRLRLAGDVPASNARPNEDANTEWQK
jgi:hypothetical protein